MQEPSKAQWQHPVRVRSWPPAETEDRIVEWSTYIADPTQGLVVDPETGDPYEDLVVARIRIGDPFVSPKLESFATGDVVEIPWRDFLELESAAGSESAAPWASLIQVVIKNQPPATSTLQRPEEKTKPAATFDDYRDLLFEMLADGPCLERDLFKAARAADLSLGVLMDARERLRIVRYEDRTPAGTEIFWRLRMSEKYKLQRRRSSS